MSTYSFAGSRGDSLAGCASFRWLALGVAFVLFSSSALGQKKEKNKNPEANTPMPDIPLPPADQIDHDIGEMLGAFQVGNVEAMHKYYAENATFSRDAFEPPVAGWQNYAALYQQQRAAFQGFQLIRRNTSIFVHGDAAWATYLWEFVGTYQDKPYSTRGQTTLVFVKSGNDWLIVHNHTSPICGQTAEQPAPQTQPQNAAPPPH